MLLLLSGECGGRSHLYEGHFYFVFICYVLFFGKRGISEIHKVEPVLAKRQIPGIPRTFQNTNELLTHDEEKRNNRAKDRERGHTHTHTLYTFHTLVPKNVTAQAFSVLLLAALR